MDNLDTNLLLQQLQLRLGELEFNNAALKSQLQGVNNALAGYKQKYGDLQVTKGGTDSPAPTPPENQGE